MATKGVGDAGHDFKPGDRVEITAWRWADPSRPEQGRKTATEIRVIDKIKNDSRTGEPRALFRNPSGSWDSYPIEDLRKI
jgi:hypothetical protein